MAFLFIKVVNHWRALGSRIIQFNLCSSGIGLVLLSKIDFGDVMDTRPIQ